MVGHRTHSGEQLQLEVTVAKHTIQKYLSRASGEGDRREVSRKRGETRPQPDPRVGEPPLDRLVREYAEYFNGARPLQGGDRTCPRGTREFQRKRRAKTSSLFRSELAFAMLTSSPREPEVPSMRRRTRF